MIWWKLLTKEARGSYLEDIQPAGAPRFVPKKPAAPRRARDLRRARVAARSPDPGRMRAQATRWPGRVRRAPSRGDAICAACRIVRRACRSHDIRDARYRAARCASGGCLAGSSRSRGVRDEGSVRKDWPGRRRRHGADRRAWAFARSAIGGGRVWRGFGRGGRVKISYAVFCLKKKIRWHLLRVQSLRVEASL